MGDGGGQAAGGRQFFGTHERLLGGIAFTDIAKDEDDADHALLFIQDGSCAVIDMEFSSMFADEDGVVGKANDLPQSPDHFYRVFNVRTCPSIENGEDVCEGQAMGLGLFPSG